MLRSSSGSFAALLLRVFATKKGLQLEPQ